MIPKYSAFLKVPLLALTLLMLSGVEGHAQFSLFKKDKQSSEKSPSRQDKDYALDLYTEAVKYDILEEYQKSLDNLKRAHELYPENSAILYKMAEVSYKQGNVIDATLYAKDALKIYDANPYYYDLLAQLHVDQNQSDEALKVYEQMVEKFPEEISYHFKLANAYLSVGKAAKAIEEYNAIEEKMGLNPDITMQKEQLYMKMGKIDLALEEAEKLLDAYPDDPYHLLNYAEILTKAGRISDAIQSLNSLLESYPNNGPTRLLLAELYIAKGDADTAYVHLLTSFKEVDIELVNKIEALSRFVSVSAEPAHKEKALVLGTILVDAHPNDANSYAIYGDLLLDNGEIDSAVLAFEQSASISPGNIRLWQQLLNLDLERQNFDDLTKHARQATEYFPNVGVFWYYVGRGMAIKGDYKEAIDAFEQALLLNSSDVEMSAQINAELGDLYYETDQITKSFESYEKALQLKPDMEHALNNYSYFLSLEKKELKKALMMSKKLVDKYPSSGTYLDTYGWVLYQMGEYQKAVDILKQAATYSRSSGEVLEHYGDALFKVGNPTEAIAQWKKALKAGGASETIEQKINSQAIKKP